MATLNDRIALKARRMTSALRALPDFLIIGGMKCGTTALYEYIVQHPLVRPALVKEVHFFDAKYYKGLGWYRMHFPLGTRGRKWMTCEASPYYLFHPAVSARIQATLPEVKLIAVLRNPVERAYSHYQHTRRKGYETLSFEEAVDQEEARLEGERERLLNDVRYRSSTYSAYSYVARGIYWKQLEPYFARFPAEQIHLVRSEDMRSNPQQVVDEVAAFLGLPAARVADSVPRNIGDYRADWTPVHERLAAYYAPHNARLKDLTGRDFMWDR